MRRDRRRCGLALPALLLAGTGFMALPSSAAGTTRGADGQVVVELAASGSTSVAQGAPFGLEVTATNPDPTPLDADIALTLGPSDGLEDAVTFNLWSVSLGGFETATASGSPIASQWFPRAAMYQVLALIDGEPVAGPLAFEVTSPTVQVPSFSDATGRVGISSQEPAPACIRPANGAAWGDADGDGDLDLYVPHQQAPAQLWMQDDAGHFVDEAAARGVDDGGSIGIGAVFVDYDNDGDQDLSVINDGPNRLYRNDGTGHFEDVAHAAGVDDPGAGRAGAWADYDGDGFVDLYVANGGNCVDKFQRDRLFHNEGDGTFTDRTALLGPPEITLGAGFQATWFDEDGDGDQDLYLANDFLGIDPNHLWRNDGPGRGGDWLFTDVSDPSGAGWAMASMGTAVGDYDRDLDLDFAVSDVGANLLARNNGDGTFTDVARAAGVSRHLQDAQTVAITWGIAFADLNLDGWEDLYVGAGTTRYRVGSTQPNEVFVNDQTGSFLDLSAPSRAADPGVSRGVALADYDRDGRLDLYVVNQYGVHHFLRNVTPYRGHHWLEVDPRGTVSNRDGCGARLVVEVAGARLEREVFCGSTSLSSGSDSVVHFGLGGATSITRVVITWPSGQTQVIADPGVDRLLLAVEPGTR